MIDLSPLVAAPGPASLRYFDPAFPDQALVLHVARPAELAPRRPRRLRAPWRCQERRGLPRLLAAACRRLVRCWQSPLSSPRPASRNTSGTILAISMPRTARRTHARSGPLGLIRGSSPPSGPGHHHDEEVRPVRTFRGWAVRPPHALIWLSRRRGRGGQRQRRHLRHARPRHRLALGPWRHRGQSATPSQRCCGSL